MRSHHDKVHTTLIRLLGIRPEPEPLHYAVPSLRTVPTARRTQALRYGDAEGGVVGRQLGQVLIGVDVKGDEGRTEDGVGGGFDDAYVHGPRVRDGDDGGHGDGLAGAELLEGAGWLVLKGGAAAKEGVAWERKGLY